MNKNQKGFTLIELMIVVAIIGILAAVAIPKFAEMMERSRDGATKGNIGAIKSAISIYYGDHEGSNPTDLTAVHPGGTSTSWNFLSKYIDNVPGVKSQGGNSVNPSTLNNGPLKYPAGAGSIGTTVWLKDFYTGGASAAGGDSLGAAPTSGNLGYGYRYESLTGLVWVNNTMKDMNSKPFTLFGYD